MVKTIEFEDEEDLGIVPDNSDDGLDFEDEKPVVAINGASKPQKSKSQAKEAKVDSVSTEKDDKEEAATVDIAQVINQIIGELNEVKYRLLILESSAYRQGAVK